MCIRDRPQPFATAACIQNEALKPVVDLTEAWNALNQDSGSMLVTGVTIVRSDFLRENRAPIQMFLEDHKESAQYAVDHVDETAELVAAAGIVEKAPIAKKALDQLPRLRGCQVHTSVMLSDVDIKVFKKLGAELTSEPVYEHKKLYH